MVRVRVRVRVGVGVMVRVRMRVGVRVRGSDGVTSAVQPSCKREMHVIGCPFPIFRKTAVGNNGASGANLNQD